MATAAAAVAAAAAAAAGGQPPIPDIDEIVRKGQEQLQDPDGRRPRRGGGRGGRGSGGGRRLRQARARCSSAPALVGLWLLMSFYTVRPEEQSVELTFGECRGDCIGEPGLNFAPWPVVTREIVQVTRREHRGDRLGHACAAPAPGLMLTGDENIVDITFQVVWNVRDPARVPVQPLRPDRRRSRRCRNRRCARSSSRSDLSPILSRDRGVISQEVQDLIQQTLDEYGSGVNIVRVNFDKADPPEQVIDAFREVQAARQERSTLQNRADAYANERLAAARGQSAQLLQEAESYRAQQVNSAHRRGEPLHRRCWRSTSRRPT